MRRAHTRMTTLAAALIATATVGIGSPSSAADPLNDPDAALRKGVPARFVMGVKFGGAGVLWDEPDSTELATLQNNQTFSVPIFDETRGGYGYSAGIFVEGIFFENLGVEVGLHFVNHTLLEDIDWSYFETTSGGGTPVTRTIEAKSEQELSWTSFHVPILIKAVIPSGKTRLSLGVGPEFAFASWARTKFEITEVKEDGVLSTDDNLVLPGTRGALTKLNSKLENSVYFTVNFGIEIIAGDFLIPIDIHWSWNFSQEKDYRDRVDLDRVPLDGDVLTQANHPTSVTLDTRDTMYGGIRVGLAYQFD
ncbi:MAG: hypothetical protein ACI9MR_001191 [Myxococcota bacterium]|jgi:hypothetical protein